MKILLADDDPDILEIVSRRLEHEGYEVVTVTNGFDAVRGATKENFDIILLDIMMPRMDGIEACRKIRKLERNNMTPIIIQTAKDQRDDVLVAVRNGASDYIVKPYSNKVLLEKIQKHQESRKSAETIAAAGRELILDVTGQDAPFPEQAANEAQGREVIESLLLKVMQIHSLPYVGKRLVEISRNSESDAQDLADTVSLDPALVLKVLKTANSSYYGFQESVSDVSQAIVRIGFSGVIDLALAEKTMDLEPQDPPGWDRLKFWEHLLGVGLISQDLFGYRMENGEDIGFLAGFLHDVGKGVYEQYMPHKFAQALYYAWQKGVPVREAEAYVIGAQHTLLGRDLLEKWGIPRIYRDVVFYHHYPWEEDRLLEHLPEETVILINIVHLADVLCKLFRIGWDGSDVVEEVPDTILKTLALSRASIAELVSRTFGSLEKVKENLHIPLKGAPRSAGITHGMRVLYLDERLRILNPGKHILQHAGARITAAYDASEIMTLVRGRHPDLIVLEMTEERRAMEMVVKLETDDPPSPVLILGDEDAVAKDFLQRRPHVAVLRSRPFCVGLFENAIEEVLRD